MSELKKSLRLAPIKNSDAAAMLDRRHPLGRGLAFAFALDIFWEDRCEGVMTFGAPITNNAVSGYGLRQDESLELRKMILSDVPPKNAESRALAVAVMLIAKQYPRLRILLTYCDTEEKAAAYKAAGWIPQKAYRYLREIHWPDGRVQSIRDFNRHGGSKVLGTKWRGVYQNRRKWVYLLDKSLASVVQSSTPAYQVGNGGSHPTRTLSKTEDRKQEQSLALAQSSAPTPGLQTAPSPPCKELAPAVVSDRQESNTTDPLRTPHLLARHRAHNLLK